MEIKKLKDRLCRLVGTEDKKVSTELVKQAVCSLKPHKMEVSRFFDHLARIFRSWLSHGNVTKSVLACAIIPLARGARTPPNPAVTVLPATQAF